MDGVLANWGAQIPARVLQEISKEKESGQTSSYIKPSQDRSYAAVTDDRKGTVSLCVCAGSGVVVVVVSVCVCVCVCERERERERESTLLHKDKDLSTIRLFFANLSLLRETDRQTETERTRERTREGYHQSGE